MNKSLARLALIIAAASPLVAVAQKAPDAKPPAEKQPAATFGGGSPLDHVFPEINFGGNPLGDVVDFLRDTVPNFKVVLVRPQGMDASDDPIVSIRLKQASLGQFLAVLSRECPIEVSTVPPTRPGEGEVTVLKVVGAPNRTPDATTGVRVYHLASIVAALRPPASPKSMLPPDLFEGPANPNGKELAAAMEKAEADAKAANEKGHKEALNDLLSLCKAALDQVGGSRPPVLQVHEATQTLIFKGTPEQQAALEGVLNSLDPNRGEPNKSVVGGAAEPSPAAVQAQIEAKLQAARKREREEAEMEANRSIERATERLDEAQKRNDELRAQLAKQQQEMMQMEREMERLKIRLEAAEKLPAGGNPPPDSKAKDSPKRD